MQKTFKYIFTSQISGRPFNRSYLLDFRTKDNACVVLDGTKVIYASETERFSKKKHDWGRPLVPMLIFKTYFDPNFTFTLTPLMQSKPNSHHINHIYEAFYQSGFKDAAVLVNDGLGTEQDCVTLAFIKEGGTPKILKKISIDKTVHRGGCLGSPCEFYAFAASTIFGHEYTEGKLMGLAAYGTNNKHTYCSWNDTLKCINYNINALADDLEQSLKISIEDIDGQSLYISIEDVKWTANEDVMAARDVAATLQKNFEDTMVGVTKYFKQLLNDTGIKTNNLCMSGGGILNCPTNSKIVDLGLFENFYASPQPSDGCAESIGRAYEIMQENGEELKSHRLESAYLGMKCPINELTQRREYLKHPIPHIIAHLKSGGIVAWYQDGAEYGPRALGHRSFLADPSTSNMLDALNVIKGREAWRPLAPVVPEELFNRVFDAQNTDMCEFMLRTLKIKQRWQSRLQAVCHKDGSTRPQLLKRKVNPQLCDLIMFYFRETSVPCLVNTSLNINGFPIVETPQDLCDLAEEIMFIDKPIPKVMVIFVTDNNFYEIFIHPSTPCS